MYKSVNTQKLASLLYVIVEIERKATAAEVATVLRISDSTFYKHIEGETTFPPDLARPLMTILDDSRLRDFFTQTGYIQVKKAPEREIESDDLYGEIVDIDDALTKLKMHIKKSLEDNNFDSKEKQKADKLLDRVEKEVEEVRNICKRK